ncbi:histidinol dehydrogenase [Flavobacteriaceae bacterium]|nr:histidinol dehydrogenase [Flavobacteriaceae bacterium]
MQHYIDPKKEIWENLLARPTASYTELEPLVAKVFNEVRERGDAALKEYTAEFDQVALTDLVVEKSAIDQAITRLAPELKQAIQLAKTNIERFHGAQKTAKIAIETQDGVECWQEKRPIQKVGLYIPGGSAPLFSTILMLAIPAQIAGCTEIVLCSPPNKTGSLPDEVLYTAALCGVSQIYTVGGIQAIAAMTFGTETIPAVYKIFGPGNQYVTVAKQWATRYNVAIDMPAGPSELLVVADHSAHPTYVAADLLSQAEHGPDSQVILVTTTQEILPKVAAEIERQLQELPRREIATKAMANSKMIAFPTDELAIDFINQYGPEHYIICMENEAQYVDAIQNAGSVFVGNYTPESAGDYASGTNHTLPTNGYAKQYSGVNLDSFLKQMTFQKISKEGIQAIGPAIEAMAAAEGLEAHKNAVTLRLNDLKYE